MSGNLILLDEPVVQKLLVSSIPGRFGYIALDGSPRVVPVWFHWSGSAIVLGTPPTAPKVEALSARPEVALSIDTEGWPPRVLQIRGVATIELVDGVVPEYAIAAERYLGPEQGRAWVEQVGSMFSQMARISIEPRRATFFDFEERFPQAIARAAADS